MRGAPSPAAAPSTVDGRRPVNNGRSAPGSPAAIEVADVVCQFGRIRALDGVSLRVMPGTVVGVLGPNGAGKTTLIDAICGLVRPSRGAVHVLGEDVSGDTTALRARIGVLPQETALYDEVTALQNLRFAAALYGVPHAEARIAEVLELVGLRERARGGAASWSAGARARRSSRPRCGRTPVCCGPRSWTSVCGSTSGSTRPPRTSCARPAGCAPWRVSARARRTWSRSSVPSPRTAPSRERLAPVSVERGAGGGAPRRESRLRGAHRAGGRELPRDGEPLRADGQLCPV